MAKANINRFNEDLDAVVGRLARKHGLGRVRGRASIDSNAINIRYKVYRESKASGSPTIGKRYFVDSLGEVTIDSYNSRARIYKWIVKDEHGDLYKVTEADLKSAQ